MKTVLFFISLLCLTPAIAAEQHFIKSNNANGEIIILDDNSVWQVASYDTITSSLWLPSSDVVVTDDEDKIVSIDDGESVDVERIR
ncbi:UNVERIFIED_ORG: hypothetical protein M2355_002074 [Lelliottia amnigena]|nr:hypothetical protein [Lelliottia amnigena]